ncbi:MAG: hypothetical protein Athens071425_247 [Parcubacteria group bacterium Athens0714_25]|nr:MAG: hypothetical protein Athens071425_247 [Parcubacteria group bacterium Athens0714_25]
MQLVVFFCLITQPLGKNIRVVQLLFFASVLFSRNRIKWLDRVQRKFIVFRRNIPLPFFSYHMQNLRPFYFFQIGKHLHQLAHIVPVNRSVIIKPQFFEKCSRSNQSFSVRLHAPRQFSDRRNSIQNFSSLLAKVNV